MFTMNDESILEDSIFKIGKVVSVEGRTIKIKVDKTKNSSHLLFKGEVLKNVSVGGYIKIVKGFTSIVGKVEGETVLEDKLLGKKVYASDKDKINRVLSVSLLGFFKNDGTFERGIKELPLIDNECFLLQKREFNKVHDFIRNGDEPIPIGSLSLEKGQEINVGVDSLFASHIGIFGNTGSGKSYTLAKIYYELFKKYKESKKFLGKTNFLLIDFNGEYVSGDSPDDVIVEEIYKARYILSTKTETGGDKLPIGSSALSDTAFWTVVLEATEKTQAPFIRRSITSAFLDDRLSEPAKTKDYIGELIYTATTKDDKNLEKGVVINLLSELKSVYDEIGRHGLGELLGDYQDNLEFHSRDGKYFYQNGANRIYSDNPNYKSDVIVQKISTANLPTEDLTDIDKVRLKIIFQYYHEIISGFSNKEHLAPLIKRMDKRIDDLKKVIVIDDTRQPKNFTVISLKDVNIDIRKILPLLICKMAYDAKKAQADPSNENYLNIIVDEAHNILSVNSERESDQWKDYRLETFEEIIKEGRKFGVFLTIASQRPYDISPTIISQLHNYFLHRLINNNDIKAIERTVSYLDQLSFESLPILPTGTCVMAGLLAQVPVVVDIGRIPNQYEPKNKTMKLASRWS